MFFLSESALKNNLEHYKAKTSSEFVCFMVKANAYGHGALEVASILKRYGAKTFGVVRVSEALRLRDCLGGDPDILLYGPFLESDISSLVSNKIQPVVARWKDLKALTHWQKASQSNQTISIHLKFDTGMNRLGFNLSEADEVIKASSPFSILGVCTHFYDAESKEKSEAQKKSFLDVFKKKPFSMHISSTKALKEDVREKLGVRVGLGIYGVSETNNLELPVLSVKSKFVEVRIINAGETVSYGAKWQSKKKSKIAVVPLGYADGIDRRLEGFFVLVRGKPVKIVGAICMDYFMVDLTDHPESASIQVGESVTLVGKDCGEEIKLTDWAKKTNSLIYELCCGFSTREPRVVIE